MAFGRPRKCRGGTPAGERARSGGAAQAAFSVARPVRRLRTGRGLRVCRRSASFYYLPEANFVGWVERSETHRGVNKDDGYRGARHRAALRADPLAPPILQTVPGFSFRCIRTTGFRHRCLTSLARRSRRETGSALRSLLPACGEKSRSEAKRMRGPLSDSERRNSAPSGEAPSSQPSPRARGEGARMRWVPRLRRPPLTSLSRTRDM